MSMRAIPQQPVATTGQSFADLGLSQSSMQFVTAVGFEHPTPIQAMVVPRALEGRDVIGLAETGSGKTAAFSLPLVERLGVKGKPGALVLSPTREIALQTQELMEQLTSHFGMRSACLIGGVKFEQQLRQLNAGAEVIVATPGRLLDHAGRGRVDLGRMQQVVLDEADHMLDLGFLPQMSQVLEATPKERQTMMFSATMPATIDRLAQRFLREPVTVDMRPAGHAAEGIEHRLYLIDIKDKKPCLLSLLKAEGGTTLVFLRRKVDAAWARRQLEIEGHSVEALHSDRTQKQRTAALNGFRQGKFRILVATDIAARGIDIPHIQHIVNYDLPSGVEDYVHRAGRTARGAATGIVSSIATWREKSFVRELESRLGHPMNRCVAPGVDPYVELKSARRRTVRRRLF